MIRGSVPLFIVIFVIYQYKKEVKIDVNCQTSRRLSVWEKAVHLAVAGDVFDGVCFAVLFPTRCLGYDLGLN